MEQVINPLETNQALQTDPARAICETLRQQWALSALAGTAWSLWDAEIPWRDPRNEQDPDEDEDDIRQSSPIEAWALEWAGTSGQALLSNLKLAPYQLAQLPVSLLITALSPRQSTEEEAVGTRWLSRIWSLDTCARSELAAATEALINDFPEELRGALEWRKALGQAIEKRFYDIRRDALDNDEHERSGTESDKEDIEFRQLSCCPYALDRSLHWRQWLQRAWSASRAAPAEQAPRPGAEDECWSAAWAACDTWILIAGQQGTDACTHLNATSLHERLLAALDASLTLSVNDIIQAATDKGEAWRKDERRQGRILHDPHHHRYSLHALSWEEALIYGLREFGRAGSSLSGDLLSRTILNEMGNKIVHPTSAKLRLHAELRACGHTQLFAAPLEAVRTEVIAQETAAWPRILRRDLIPSLQLGAE